MLYRLSPDPSIPATGPTMPLPSGVTRVAPVLALLALAACSRSEKSIADTTSTPIAPPSSTPAATAGGSTSAAGSIALADVAGTWKMRSVPTTGADTSPTLSTLTATGEAGGWKMVFGNGLTQAIRVTAVGDSIIYDMGPYQSVRRKGVSVTTHGVLRKQGDKLVGTIVAHYASVGPDSVVTLRSEGTKAP
jgi:hypothetical protein